MEPKSSSVIKKSQEMLQWYNEHPLMGYLANKSSRKAAKRNCKTMQEKQVRYATLATHLFEFMKLAYKKGPLIKKGCYEYLVTIENKVEVKNKAKGKNLEKSSDRLLSEKYDGVPEKEKKYLELTFKITNLTLQKTIITQGDMPYLIRECNSFGQVSAKKLIKMLGVQAEKDYKPEFSNFDLSSTSSDTSESESERPHKPARSIVVSEFAHSNKPEPLPTQNPSSFIRNNRNLNSGSTPVNKPESPPIQMPNPVFPTNPKLDIKPIEPNEDDVACQCIIS